MTFTDALEASVLDHLVGRATWAQPATLFVGLSTTAPADDGTGITEPVGNAYARVSYGPGPTNWNRSGNVLSNALQVLFPAPTPAGWGTLTHWFIATAASGGVILVTAALATPRTPAVNVAPVFAPGALTVSLD